MSLVFDGRIVIGPLERIEDVDDGACAILGYTRAELLQLHGTQLVPVERHPATAVTVDRMRHGEVAWELARLLRKDGSVVEVEVHATSLPRDRLEFLLRRVA